MDFNLENFDLKLGWKLYQNLQKKNIGMISNDYNKIWIYKEKKY